MTSLPDLLSRVEGATGADRKLDGELDGLVGHEGEAWPAPYTQEVLHLQRITPQLGLDISDVSAVALKLMSDHPWRPVALLYAEALLRALIAQEDVKPFVCEGDGASVAESGSTAQGPKSDRQEGH